MKKLELKYGEEKVNFELDEKNVLQVIEPNPYYVSKTEEQIIDEAIKNPIGSARLNELVHAGESVCIVIPDATRAWQKISMYAEKIVEELNSAGVEDKDIIFLSALGTHRKQTKEEHEILLGKKLYKRFKVIDHDCFDDENLEYLGKTTYGTPVIINKLALQCDHLIITGGIVYHFLAGWAGGRKSILPGIAAYKTIMANHGLSLNKEFGSGINSDVRSAKVINNPIHDDMVQAASFVRPTFMFNVVMGPDGKIAGAVAGNYLEAHTIGREMVNKIDSVKIKEKGDIVIASAGGYPKDINLYQTIKALINAQMAVKENGTIILVSECEEGLGGDDDNKNIILNFDNMIDREKDLREKYSISKFVGYYYCYSAEKYNLILVSKIDSKLLKTTNIKIARTFKEALKMIEDKINSETKINVMTYANNTLPVLEK